MTIVKISAHTNQRWEERRRNGAKNAAWVVISKHRSVHCLHSLKEDLFHHYGGKLLKSSLSGLQRRPA